jgi:SAM-dependent MidA family methyltransferase
LDSGLLAVLPDGFLLDVSPSAEGWWRDVACLLIHGKLLTLDYGLTSEELFQPERKEGTLRAYRLHRMLTDVLADPGEQDLTAHVNFSAIQAAGEAAGLRTESFVTQERFLTEIVARNSEGQPAAISWTPARKRQFQTLTHPDLMGRRFRVLIQSR